MSMYESERQFGSEATGDLVLHQGLWGLVSASDRNVRMLEAFELSAKVLGLLLPTLAGIIFLIGPVIGIEDPRFRLILPAFLTLGGFLLYSVAIQGLVAEIHIDAPGRKILVGSRDSHGRFFAKNSYPFDRIVSVFIRRAKNQDALATLNLRLRGTASPVRILRGTESSLRAVLEYIASEHAASSASKGRSTTKTVARYISVDLFSR
ncbi:MAG: hypothetical protein RIE24_07625 [Silicimonas sp.]